MTMNFTSPLLYLSIVSVLWLLSASAFSACDFDTDDADSPNFVDKIIECDEKEKTTNESTRRKAADIQATKLYGDGTLDRASGIFERPIVAGGSMNHSPNKAFTSRQAYSLRPGAKFEQSVTLAIQRLHIEMAHHCAKGWSVDRQWSEPNPEQEGDYFLHYRFICAS
jgi:hypothetical protein|tara:strand:+ start:74 stop:574 length:501 start_codon:yes stop_codon:yes gene_type:complete